MPLFQSRLFSGMLAKGVPVQASAGIRVRCDFIGVVLGITGTFSDIAEGSGKQDWQGQGRWGKLEGRLGSSLWVSMRDWRQASLRAQASQ